MQTDNPGHIQLGQLVSSVGGPYRNEVGHFGEHVHYHPDRVVASGGLWKSYNEVHTNVIPLPLRNLQGLQKSCGLLMLCFDSVAYVAAGNIVGDILPHPGPPAYG